MKTLTQIFEETISGQDWFAAYLKRAEARAIETEKHRKKINEEWVLVHGRASSGLSRANDPEAGSS